MEAEVDLETLYRSLIGKLTPESMLEEVFINDENRVVFRIGTVYFVLFGNNVAQWKPKPPTQTVGVNGFDAFKSKGVGG